MSGVKSVKAMHVSEPQTAATTSASTDTVPRLIFITSRVNSAPPIGALNIPAIPAPAPQPISIRSIPGDNPSQRPRLLPMAAPV